MLNGYTIVFAATLVPAGRFADKVGRKRMFVAGLVTFIAASLLCALAPSIEVLIAARALQAMGGGMMIPAAMSILLATVPVAARARALGTWSAIGALGATVGPVLGGLLVQASWRWVFWINIPIGLLAVALAFRVLPESRDERTQDRPDLLGAALLATGVGLIALALVKAPGWGWGSARFMGALVLASACIAAMLARCAHHPAPVIELALLGSRTFNATLAASVLFYAGFDAFTLASVEFLTAVWHYSALRAGLTLAPGALVVVPVARQLTPRVIALLGGAGRVVLLGCLTYLISQALWIAFIQPQPDYLTFFLPIQLIAGVGVGLTIPSLIAAGSAAVPPARFGTGSGILNMARQIGTVLGVAGLVAILAQLDDSDAIATFRESVELVGAFTIAVALTASLTLTRRTSSAPAAADAAAERA